MMMGLNFLEARINSLMSMIPEKPDTQLLRRFLTAEPEFKEARRGPLLVAQVTFFKCGGMAIGLCISQNAMDAASLTRFLNCWTSTSLGSSGNLVTPKFSAAALLVPIDFSNYSDEPPVVELIQGKCITRRFVSETAKTASLRSKATSKSVKNPTRVEAVSTLLWKSAMEASRLDATNSLKFPSPFCQIVNLRSRTIPSSVENLVGNLVGNFPARIEDHSYAIDVKILVANLRKVIEEVKVKYGAKGLDVEEIEQSLKKCANLLMNNGIESYCCSSWCRFPFYRVDFVCGEPSLGEFLWIGIQEFYVFDESKKWRWNRGMVFGKQNMELVERNQDLLAFAALNPSVF